MDSGSSTPSSMVPSAGASPRRWSSFGTKAARISEEGGRLLRRVSEAAGIAEEGTHARASAHTSGDSSPDEGNAAAAAFTQALLSRELSIQSAWLLTFSMTFVYFRQKCAVRMMAFMPCMPVGCCELILDEAFCSSTSHPLSAPWSRLRYAVQGSMLQKGWKREPSQWTQLSPGRCCA